MLELIGAIARFGLGLAVLFVLVVLGAVVIIQARSDLRRASAARALRRANAREDMS